MRVNPGLQITATATEVWLSEVRAGRCFTRGVNLAPSPGNISEAQLINPVGSGVQVLLRAFMMSADVANVFTIGRFDTNLTTDVGTGFNLLINGAASQGHVRTNQPAALDGTTFGFLRSSAQTPIFPAPDWFMELSPGQGFLIGGTAANTALTVNFFWNEK